METQLGRLKKSDEDLTEVFVLEPRRFVHDMPVVLSHLKTMVNVLSGIQSPIMNSMLNHGRQSFLLKQYMRILKGKKELPASTVMVDSLCVSE